MVLHLAAIMLYSVIYEEDTKCAVDTQEFLTIHTAMDSFTSSAGTNTRHYSTLPERWTQVCRAPNWFGSGSR